MQMNLRRERGQQGRFATSVRADDLSTPIVGLQAIDKYGRAFSSWKQIRNAPGFDPTTGEGIGLRREPGRDHFSPASRAGALLPSWKGASTRNSLRSAPSNRTRTHQRILTMMPS